MSDDSVDPSIDEERIRRFESAWRRGEPPDMARFLPPEHDPRRRAILEELVCIDLEFVLKQAPEGGDGPAEDYLRRFPELNDPQFIKRLAREELYVRRRLGESPSLAEYERRFPGVVSRADMETTSGVELPSHTPVDVGQVIGPYRLLQKLGEGGFGIVFLAEQTSPVQRRVALKVIKPGMDSNAILTRFQAEQQTLALMDHESIARVFDAGQTDLGQPFFVMELVEGVPITQFCDQQRWSAIDRVQLFIQVCHAIQHAHQKGIIHRDIKPSNILVTSDEARTIPKVIDFGIAKALDRPPADSATFTQHGQIIGTPQYMSPEQAEGAQRDVDTRSDVYSLGVLLYELLTGSTPIPLNVLRQAAMDEMLRLVREGQHPKPSTRISQSGETLHKISRDRCAEPRKLGSLLRGELDWIVMKALEKECPRRYATASAFAADLRRYLDQEPVEAGPPSALYRLSRLARKYRAQVATAAVLLAMLVLATVTSTVFYLRSNVARAAEQVARREAESLAARKQRVVDVFVSAFRSPDPTRKDVDYTMTATDVLRQAQEELQTELEDDPLTKAALLNALGLSFLNLGEYDSAISAHSETLAIHKAELSAEDPGTVASMNNLAAGYHKAGRVQQAISLWEEILDQRRAALGPAHRDTIGSMDNLAGGYYAAGRLAEAIPLWEAALTLAREQFPPRDPDLLVLTGNLAGGYHQAGQLTKAVPLFEETLRARREVLGETHPHTLMSLNHLATAYWAAGKLSAAIELYTDALQLTREKLGPDHPQTWTSMNYLALGYSAAGQIQKAVPLYEETLRLRRGKLGPQHPATLESVNNLASAYRRMGQLEKAIPLYESNLQATREKLGDEHPDTITSLAGLAAVYYEAEQVQKALRLFEQALQLAEEHLPEDHPYTLQSRSNLATCYAAAGQVELALPQLETTLLAKTRKFGRAHPSTLSTMSSLAGVLYTDGQLDKALALFQEALSVSRSIYGDHHRETQDLLRWQQSILLALEDYLAAEVMIRQWMTAQQADEAVSCDELGMARTSLAASLLGQAKNAEAEAVASEALASEGITPVDAARAHSIRGLAAARRGAWDEAEPEMTAAFESLEQHIDELSPFAKWYVSRACERMIELYQAWGKTAQVDAWTAKRDELIARIRVKKEGGGA